MHKNMEIYCLNAASKHAVNDGSENTQNSYVFHSYPSNSQKYDPDLVQFFIRIRNSFTLMSKSI
jgi:hypothetical protein